MFITSGRESVNPLGKKLTKQHPLYPKVTPKYLGIRTANEKHADEYKEEPAGCTRFKRFNSLRVF